MSELLEIGGRVRALRESRGASQEDLAQIMDVTATAVSKLEKGNRGLAATELAAICDAFGVRSDELLFGDPAQPAAGALLRADSTEEAPRVLDQVEEAFANLRYVRALIES